jgi:hypothetical protein
VNDPVEELTGELKRQLAPILSQLSDPKIRDQLEQMAVSSTVGVQRDTSRAAGNMTRALAMLRLQQNLSRAENLGTDFIPAGDLVRAVVVFTHAALEDYLRTVGLRLLPMREASALANIPLAGRDRGTRPEKFSLDDLARFRELTVQDVIRKSVKEHLDQKSFTSADEVAKFLEKLGIKASKFSDYLPILDALISRRHQIVHRADLAADDDSPDAVPQVIDGAEVNHWIETATRFVADVGQTIGLGDVLPRMKAIIDEFRSKHPPEGGSGDDPAKASPPA